MLAPAKTLVQRLCKTYFRNKENPKVTSTNFKADHLNKINKVHIQQVFYLPSLYWISSNSLKLLIEVLTEVKILHQNVNSKL